MLPLQYCSAHFSSPSNGNEIALKNLCPSCSWFEKQRNFGVIPSLDATNISANCVYQVTTFVTVIGTFVLMVFSVTCTIHIFRMISMYRHLKSSVRITITLRQTRQSLVQVF
ncbi:hypothetical protein PENTCL1PPCAC_16701, partial [Pristionchus entomophagus]